MYTEYYFDVGTDTDWDADAECDSETRSKALPKAKPYTKAPPWTKAEHDRDMAGIYRVIVVSTVLICDLKFGMNLFTVLATIAAVPLVAHLRD